MSARAFKFLCPLCCDRKLKDQSREICRPCEQNVARVLVLYSKVVVSSDLPKALKVSAKRLQGMSAHELFALMTVRLLPEESKTRDAVLRQMKEWKKV